MSEQEHIGGVVCCWEYVPSATKFPDDCTWKLAESYAIDIDGHAIYDGHPSFGEDWHDWLFERREEGDSVHLHGRVATVWTLGGGVRLLAVHPPLVPPRPLELLPPWLSSMFLEKLPQLRECWEIIQRGHQLYFGTANEALHYVLTSGRRRAN